MSEMAEAAKANWLARLAVDEDGRSEIATEMTIEALSLLADRTNYRMLSRLRRDGSVPVEELMAVTGLGRLALLERAARLTQAGLVTREIESDRVTVSRLTMGLLGLVERVCAVFSAKIGKRLPRLLEGQK